MIATAVLLWVNVNYAQMTNLFRVEQRSVAFTIATLLNIGITVPLTVILVVVYKEGPLGIIVGNLSGTLVVFIALLGYRREQLGLQFDRKLLQTMNRFGFPLMAAGLAIWVMNFGDRLMLGKLLHGHYALVQLGQYSLANKIGSAMVLLFTAFQIAWPAFAYSIEDEKEAKRTYSYVLTYLMFIAAWAAIGLSLFAPWIVHFLAPQARLLARREGGAGSRVLQRLLRRLHRRDDRHRPVAQDAVQLDRGDGRRHPQLHAEPLADPGLRDARSGVRHPRRLRS